MRAVGASVKSNDVDVKLGILAQDVMTPALSTSGTRGFCWGFIGMGLGGLPHILAPAEHTAEYAAYVISVPTYQLNLPLCWYIAPPVIAGLRIRT